MCFKTKYISKKELREMLSEIGARNYDLANTNKILKNYIRYLKKKTSEKSIGCDICMGRMNWMLKLSDKGWIAVNYCPKCGREIVQEKS